MTWGSFVDFWLMRDMGHEDAVLRNYDVMKFVGPERTSENGWNLHLWLALKRIGIHSTKSEESLNYLPEVAARLQAMGHPRPDFEQVRIRLIAWFTWDRIRKGDIQQWFIAEHIRQMRTSRSNSA